MTPDQPITLAVAVFGSVLCLALPLRAAVLPLLISMFTYPTIVNIPPDALQLTAQRVIGLVLFARCVSSHEVRQKFKWQLVDSVAVMYFLLLLSAQVMTAKDVGAALNNRAGFFLSALVPFWCVRMLVTDRSRMYIMLKGMIWGALPMIIEGIYQMQTGQSPYEFIMENGKPEIWGVVHGQWFEIRPFLGFPCHRASAPFQQCIMFGWFFAILITPGTNLFWQKRKIWPWVLPWMLLPMGTISTVSAGPMMMGGVSFMLLMLFPMRQFWKGIFGTMGTLYIAVLVFAKRTPLEIIAGFGFDQSSSWYRVNLLNFTLGTGMRNHWLAGYGLIPSVYDAYHDLCIQWIYLAVVHGMMGVVGFFSFVAASAWNLWRAKRKAASVEDEWLLWSLLCTLIATLLAMGLVALFGEMWFIYHMFLGLVANTPMIMGNAAPQQPDRQIGVLAELDGRQVLLRYRLKPGQKLAIIHPPGAGEAAGPEAT